MFNFGKHIKIERHKKDLLLKDFAKKLGYSPSYISDIEHGRTSPLNIELLKNISKILDIDYEELYDLAIQEKKEARFKLDKVEDKIVIIRLAKMIEKYGLNPKKTKQLSNLLKEWDKIDKN